MRKMTIDQAIIELTRYLNEPYSSLHPYFSDAVKLALITLMALNNTLKEVSK